MLSKGFADNGLALAWFCLNFSAVIPLHFSTEKTMEVKFQYQEQFNESSNSLYR
jgi:hypothetical protein